ncbi:hypothetical protein D9M72_653920 [compost metagenome]
MNAEKVPKQWRKNIFPDSVEYGLKKARQYSEGIGDTTAQARIALLIERVLDEFHAPLIRSGGTKHSEGAPIACQQSTDCAEQVAEPIQQASKEAALSSV